jgi:hypothetical protein
MERSRWRRPSPALVVACLALFVALGGTVLAATKIDGRTIRVKSLPGNRLEVGSVPANRLAPGSVKGEQVDAGTLAQVPNAAHADSAVTARHAETAVAADHAADATTVNGRSVGCGGDQREFAGACWGLKLTTTALGATEAAVACATAGGRLPDTLALLAFMRLPGVPADTGGEWTSEVHVESEDFWSGIFVEGDHHIASVDAATPHYFRCVTPLLK